MRCPKCGSSFTGAPVFCKNCGTRLTAQQNAPNFSSQNIGETEQLVPVPASIKTDLQSKEEHTFDEAWDNKGNTILQKFLKQGRARKNPPPPPTVVTESHSQSPLPEIPLTILRAFEFYGGNIRVKISVKNLSQSAALDVVLDWEVDETTLYFERHEPEYPLKKGMIQLGNILPGTDKTVSLIFEPLICAKEGTAVNCRIDLKDAAGLPHSQYMEPLKIQVICPIFETTRQLNIAQLRELVEALPIRHNKVYTIPRALDLHETLALCNEAVQLNDVRHTSTLRKDEMYEAWYAGTTKISQRDLVIKLSIRKETESIELTVAGDDAKDITGLLAEIHRNLMAKFAGRNAIQPVLNIRIKDSVIQRSDLLSFCNLDGTCGGDVVIEDSVLIRSNVGGGGNRG